MNTLYFRRKDNGCHEMIVSSDFGDETFQLHRVKPAFTGYVEGPTYTAKGGRRFATATNTYGAAKRRLAWPV